MFLVVVASKSFSIGNFLGIEPYSIILTSRVIFILTQPYLLEGSSIHLNLDILTFPFFKTLFHGRKGYCFSLN